MIELNGLDEHAQEVLQRIAIIADMDVQEATKKIAKMMQAVGESVTQAVEKLGYMLEELPDLPRSPVEIKKDIKHEKNPMRLKQLNKELNESYKVYKRKRGRGINEDSN